MIPCALRPVFRLRGRNLLTVKMFSSRSGVTRQRAQSVEGETDRVSKRSECTFPRMGFQAESPARDSDD